MSSVFMVKNAVKLSAESEGVGIKTMKKFEEQIVEFIQDWGFAR